MSDRPAFDALVEALEAKLDGTFFTSKEFASAVLTALPEVLAAAVEAGVVRKFYSGGYDHSDCVTAAHSDLDHQDYSRCRPHFAYRLVSPEPEEPHAD